MCGDVRVQRFDQWLNNGNRTIKCAYVTPRFKKVRGGNNPVAKERCFGRMQRMMHGGFRFSESACELDISGRVVNRIASKNNEQLHFALVHFPNELPQVINLISKL